jgi:hypothetical protein
LLHCPGQAKGQRHQRFRFNGAGGVYGGRNTAAFDGCLADNGQSRLLGRLLPLANKEKAAAEQEGHDNDKNYDTAHSFVLVI